MDESGPREGGVLWRVYSGEAFSPPRETKPDGATGVGPGGPRPGDEKPAQAREAALLMACTVAGAQYSEAGRVWDELGPDARLELRREPENPHDSKAVAVYWRGRKLGYLPRYLCGRPAALMDQRRTVFATLACRPSGRPGWGALQIKVWLEQ